jgi:hypothetical protein
VRKSKNPPASVVRVPTYAELEHYARAFAVGHLNLLMLCGTPGLGKSQCFRRALGGKVCWIDGNASAFGIYLLAQEHRDRPIVLDDVDGLYRDRQGIRLLKALCQTDMVKHVSWQTAATSEGLGIPQQFTTTSKVAIIANQWKSLNEDVAALEDRGHCLEFVPSATEIHRHAAGWFWDQQVFDFVAAHLHLIQQHSLRTYVLAWELRQAGLDWRQAVLSRCLSGTALEVAKFHSNPSYATEEDRARAFVAAGLGCRSTYFNYAKKLKSHQVPAAIKLVQSSPPTAIKPSGDILDIFRRRYGQLGNG